MFLNSRKLRIGVAALLAAASYSAAFAGPGDSVPPVSCELVSNQSELPPGQTLPLAAVVTIRPGWHIQANPPTFDYLIPSVLEVEAPPEFTVSPIEYPSPVRLPVAFSEEPLAVYKGRTLFRFNLTIPQGARGTTTLQARLRYQACDDKRCLPPAEVLATATFPIGVAGVPQHAELFESDATSAAPVNVSAGNPGFSSFLAIVGLAILGGLILNAMPCVLPVLSLKAVGLVRAAEEGGPGVRSRALATAGGIFLSFWALAALAVVVRAAGITVGWGIQFQEPRFVGVLAVIVLLFALNLWGLFEITPSSGVLSAAERQSRRSSISGDLAAGAFATLMATPCSAPFLGTALSFALAQSAPTIFGIFSAIGFGFALPYLALAVWPKAVQLLPQPGAWMERLKTTLGFLLAGALVWLFYVLQAQVSPEALALFQLSLFAIALVVWLGGQGASLARKRLSWAVAFVLGWSGVALLGSSAPQKRAAALSETSKEIPWIPFDREAAFRLSSEEKRLVFVDITADWCVTCKVNERLVLSHPEVVQAFERYQVVAMKGDWTNRNEEIARFLSEHGRSGIPFYLLYRPDQKPLLFSELITRHAILEALEQSQNLRKR